MERETQIRLHPMSKFQLAQSEHGPVLIIFCAGRCGCYTALPVQGEVQATLFYCQPCVENLKIRHWIN
jgi:hypothetical protein